MAELTQTVDLTIIHAVPKAQRVVQTVHGQWEQLRSYANGGIMTQMRQWEQLTASINEL